MSMNRTRTFKDILERLPTNPENRIEELLSYNWQPPSLAD